MAVDMIVNSIRNYCLLVGHCNKLQFGSFSWLMPLGVLIYPFSLVLLFAFDIKTDNFHAVDVQNNLIGLPIYILSICLGAGIVASEIENRTLEVTAFVPNGVGQVWKNKLLAATTLVLAAITLLAFLVPWIFTSYPLGVLYRVFQGAIFFLVLSMGVGALLSSLVVAILSSLVILSIVLRTGGSVWSPIFNPLALARGDNEELWRLLLQNHVITFIIIVLIALLTFMRTERLELLLK